MGGVPGQKVSTLAMADTPDRVEALRPQRGVALAARLGEWRQQIEMPEPGRRSRSTGRSILTARAGAPTRASSRLRSRRT